MNRCRTLGVVLGVLAAIALCASARAATLSVDIGLTGQNVQYGWDAVTRSDGVTSTSDVFTSTMGASGTVTLAMSPISGWRDRGDYLHPVGDVLEDFLFTGGSMTLTLSDLKPGTYYLRSYHHDYVSQGTMDVRLTDAVRTNRLMFDDISQTTSPIGGSAGPVRTVPMIVTVDSTGVASVSLTKNGNAAVLNGFEITDSPPPQLNIDFGEGPAGRVGNDVQSGFQSFVMVNSGNYTASPQEHWFFTELANAGSARVRVAAPGGSLGFRDRGDVTHALGDLAEDFVFNYNADDRLDLTLGSLQPGLYSVTAYLHDQAGAFPGTVDVRISDALGSERLAQAGVSVSTGASPASIATATVQLYSNGIDPVVIHFDEGTAGIVPLAGFEARASAPSLRVDFARANGDEQGYTHDVQNGFVAFARTTTGDTAGGQTETYASPMGAGGTVAVRLEGNSNTLRWRDRGDVLNAELGDVAEDFVFNNEWVEVVLEGLLTSRYIVTSYHNDPSNTGAIDILVSDALGTNRLVADDLVMASTRLGDPARATFEVLAKGPVTIRFQESTSAAYAMLNGLSITMAVPEPSGLVLGCLGLLGLACVARWRRSRPA